MSKDLPQEREPGQPRDSQGKGRDYNKGGACFTRIESIMRSISFSCTIVGWNLK
jgi:hypothetical protein